MADLKHFSLLIFCFLFTTYGLKAQTKNPLESGILELDSTVHAGELKNGFRYFIKPLTGSKDGGVQIKLFNLAGSNQEETGWPEVAHALEHLAFKPTKSFPRGIEYSPLADMGLGIRNSGAMSGRKVTVYNYTIPADKPEALDYSLLWFKDIINGLIFSEEHVKAVAQELGQEANAKFGEDLNRGLAEMEVYNKIFPCFNSFTSLDVFERLTPEVLLRFYNKWYNPNSLILVMVGNIPDVEKMEKKIKQNFSGIRAKEPGKFRECDKEFNEQPVQFVTIERKVPSSKTIYAKSPKFHFFFRDPNFPTDLNTMKGLKEYWIRKMVISAVNMRLEEASSEYGSSNSFMLNPFHSRNLPVAMHLTLEARNGYEKFDVEKIYKILHQLEKLGLSTEEWSDIKQDYLKSFSNLKEEGIQYWEGQISNYFVLEETLPYNKTKILKDWFQNLDVADINYSLNKYLKRKPVDIAILAPTGHPALMFDEKEVRSWIKTAYDTKVSNYTSKEKITGLMSIKEIESVKTGGHHAYNDSLPGVKEWTLENGVKLVLESSTDSGDLIKIHGFSPKGGSCYGENIFTAFSAPGIVMNSGVNDIDKFQMKEYLSSNGLMLRSVAPYIDESESGINARATPANLEVVLQLIYLYFTRPNKDPLAFKDWKEGLYNGYADPSYDVSQADFFNYIQWFTGDFSIANSPIGKATLGTKFFEVSQEMDLDLAYRIYKELFSNASDFTFIIKGNFKVDSVLPLFQKYLGNLPNTVSISSKKNNNCCKEQFLPEGPVIIKMPPPETYEMGTVRYAMKFIQKRKDTEDWRQEKLFETFVKVMWNEAWKLRWEKNYSLYMVGVKGGYNKSKKRFEINFYVNALPEELPMIKKDLKQIIEEVKAGNLENSSFEKGKREIIGVYKSGDSFLTQHDELYEHYRYSLPWVEQQEVVEYLNNISSKDVMEFAREFLKDKNSFEFLMTTPIHF